MHHTILYPIHNPHRLRSNCGFCITIFLFVEQDVEEQIPSFMFSTPFFAPAFPSPSSSKTTFPNGSLKCMVIRTLVCTQWWLSFVFPKCKPSFWQGSGTLHNNVFEHEAWTNFCSIENSFFGAEVRSAHVDTRVHGCERFLVAFGVHVKPKRHKAQTKTCKFKKKVK